MGLTTEPQQKTAGSQGAMAVNEGVHSKIRNLKYVPTTPVADTRVLLRLERTMNLLCH